MYRAINYIPQFYEPTSNRFVDFSNEIYTFGVGGASSLMQDVNFERGYLLGKQFHGDGLTGTLEGANFRNSYLENASFQRMNLDGADFTGADLTGVVSYGNTGNPILPAGYSFINGSIVGADVYLDGADLSG